MCVFCAEGCITCHDGSGTNDHCDACDTGLLFYPDSEICLSYCPTGYKVESNECVNGSDSDEQLDVITLFEFDLYSADSTRAWTYSGAWDDSSGTTGVSHSWQVKTWGGENESTAGTSDPYLTAERGLFFDGS